MLHSDTIGTGPDLIFLHGLFGAGDNWRSIGKSLSEDFTVHMLDLPNHGRSPWTDEHTLETLAASVNQWIIDRGINQYRLLGHSLGGKVAMQLALNEHHGSLQQLIVVDIAPRVYPPHHQNIFDALNSTDFDRLTDRKAIEEDLKDKVTDAGIRQFLLKSLSKQNGKLSWRFNVRVLENKYDAIALAPSISEIYLGPTLFIKGMNSDYIRAEDQPIILDLFPNAKAKLIEGAGHWPHAEKPVVFTKILKDFLTKD